MHKYIDTSKLRNFSKKKTFKSIYKDIEERYKITNICDDDGESLYYLCATLLEDYNMKRANYESYIEVGMNARFMMELRRNAILIMGEGLEDFYEKHRYCETLEDIKNLRIEYLKHANEEYIDLNWQYYYVVKINLGRKKTEGFIFDFESCYADGNWRKQTNPQDYETEFRRVHSYDGILEQIRREYGETKG